MKVQIDAVWYDCDSAGKKIKVTSGTNGEYICPTPANKWCSEVNSYSSWPQFLSIDPKKGRIGDSITVKGNSFLGD